MVANFAWNYIIELSSQKTTTSLSLFLSVSIHNVLLNRFALLKVLAVFTELVGWFCCWYLVECCEPRNETAVLPALSCLLLRHYHIRMFVELLLLRLGIINYSNNH